MSEKVILSVVKSFSSFEFPSSARYWHICKTFRANELSVRIFFSLSVSVSFRTIILTVRNVRAVLSSFDFYLPCLLSL